MATVWGLSSASYLVMKECCDNQPAGEYEQRAKIMNEELAEGQPHDRVHGVEGEDVPGGDNQGDGAGDHVLDEHRIPGVDVARAPAMIID